MSDETMSPLRGPMTAAAAALRGTFEGIVREHSGELGRRREDAFRTVLRQFLPKRLGVTTGEIVAATGEYSPQVDVIIYDALETPLLDASESGSLVPAEGVYAVIELASQLNGPKLREDAAKIREIKSLPKTEAAYGPRWEGPEPVDVMFSIYGRQFKRFPTLGFIFGFESAGFDTLLRALKEVDEATSDLAEQVDAIGVLSRGCILNGVREGESYTDIDGTPTPQRERVGIDVDPDDDPGVSLMLFFIAVSTQVSPAWTESIMLRAYTEF